MVVLMEIKLANGVKQIKIKTMKFKVINDENNKVIAMNLDIDVARKIARAYNKKHKSDIFTINSQADYVARSGKNHGSPYKNGEEVSELIKREIKQFLAEMIKKHPNDASLGAAIRESYK